MVYPATTISLPSIWRKSNMIKVIPLLWVCINTFSNLTCISSIPTWVPNLVAIRLKFQPEIYKH